MFKSEGRLTLVELNNGNEGKVVEPYICRFCGNVTYIIRKDANKKPVGYIKKLYCLVENRSREHIRIS